MPLFHVAPLALRPRSIIEPGNFGRILSHYNYLSDNGWMIARELAFEMERAKNVPNAPSRLSSCFALGDLNEALRYQATNSRLAVLLEVELDDPSARQHWGFMEHFDGMENQRFLGNATQRAAAYWAGQGQGDRELVTESGLIVVRRIN